MILPPKPIHPEGEQKQIQKRSKDNQIGIDTFDGKVKDWWGIEDDLGFMLKLGMELQIKE